MSDAIDYGDALLAGAGQKIAKLRVAIAAKDSEIEKWRSRALEDNWPFEWIVASELRELLQAKDEQIERLVDGILSIPEWMSGRSSHICPFCKGTIEDHKDGCLRKVAEAIKEATDG